MPLLDHFHPPLSVSRHWQGFHNAWATYIAAHLNERLPPGYFAEPNVQFGIEIDVAAFQDNGHASEAASWTPSAPVQTLPLAATTDIVEVAVYHQQGGPTLAAAIELVSPANKDRPAHRDALVQKCATYIREGMGLVVVDVVTDRTAGLHARLINMLGSASASDAELFAASYRPVEREGAPHFEVWHEPLAVGGALPTLPLWLRGEFCLPLDLSATYDRTCREQRLG